MVAFAEIPGLQVCRRTVLTPRQHSSTLGQYPDLIYATLMPWVEGPTWMDVVLEAKGLTPEDSLNLARSLTQTLAAMEERGLAHCDLSGPNLLMPALRGGKGVALIDVEQMFGPDFKQPQALPGGSPGYARRAAFDGLWSSTADRFAGAVVMGEILGWCDQRVREDAWGESYFDPTEMQRDVQRYVRLTSTLRERWGQDVTRLFQRAWQSEALADCPTFCEWLAIMPDTVPATPGQRQSVEQLRTAEPRIPTTIEAIVRELTRLARVFEDQGKLESALESFRRAQAQAPAESELAHELAGVVKEVETNGHARTNSAPPASARNIVPAWVGVLTLALGLLALAIALLVPFGTPSHQAVQSILAPAMRAATSSSTPSASQLEVIEAVVIAWTKSAKIYGPLSGSIAHVEDNKVGFKAANANSRDLVAETRFYNPFDRLEHAWDYGILFRHSGWNKQYRLTVNSDGKWRLSLHEESGYKVINQGEAKGLDVTAWGANHLRLIIQGDVGLFFVNSNYVATLDVSGKQVPGDVLVATGSFSGNKINGRSTRYEDFTVWKIP